MDDRPGDNKVVFPPASHMKYPLAKPTTEHYQEDHAGIEGKPHPDPEIPMVMEQH